MDCIHHYESPLGGITLAGDENGLTGLWFDGQAHFAATLSADHQPKMLPVFTEAEQWLDRYFSGKIPDFTPALNLRGTPFRRLVWAFLLTIPYGRTVTYGEIASRLAARTGRPVSAQAVGGAVGHNPVSLIVPCHRVIGAGGSLTGYAGGLDRKTQLLRLEQQYSCGKLITGDISIMYTIKKLDIESLDAILALEKLCFPVPDRWKEEDWRRLLERDRDTYYAMMDGDRLIGNVFICNWLGEHDYVKIMNVSVHPDYRNQGIACRLLNRVTEDMTQLGMYRFCGETRSTNTAMQKAFEACGYKLDRIEEHYFQDPDESAWKYVLSIQPQAGN